MSMFTTPRARAQTGDGLELTKEDLVNDLIVIRVDEFDPEASTTYGKSATLLAHVTVVDGVLAGQVEPRFFCAGNLAKQIGNALDVGQMAPGRIVKGQSKGDREWFGIEWATDQADLAAAEAAMRPQPKVPVTMPHSSTTARPEPTPSKEQTLKQQIRADQLRRRVTIPDLPQDTEDPPF